MSQHKLSDEHKEVIGPAEAYERDKVPILFRPAATLFLRFLSIESGAAVLDVACGTGIVVRMVAERMGAEGTFVGVDLDADMIAVARASSPKKPSITYHVSNVENMPFLENETFDWVLCQQGFQYFQDKARALREIRRVLRPGGRLGLIIATAVTPEQQPYQWAKAEAIRKLVGPEAGEKQLKAVPYFDRSEDDLRAFLVIAGFQETTIRNEVHLRQRGFPTAEDFSNLDQESGAAVAAAVKNSMKPYWNKDGMAVPHSFHIVVCAK